jgi:acetoin utilization protein AcuB
VNKINILVKEWMSQPVHVLLPDTPVGDAYNMMMDKSIRRLPVVDTVDNDKLVGIVTLGDLREARPSPASSLSIYELNYKLSKLTVGEVMTHNPYTVTPDTAIQEAARIMLEHKVSGLPVVDAEEQPIGIVTETDIFRMLLDQWDYFTAPKGTPYQHTDQGLLASLVAEETDK